MKREAVTASTSIAVSAATIVTPAMTPSVFGASISSGLASLIGSAIGALVAYGIARHQQKAQNDRERMKAAHDSASSHMANVAFDKYVEFCEAYKDSAGEGVLILIQHGPTREILPEVGKLSEIRYKYSLWIPADVDDRLKAFESVWRTIGAFSGLLDRSVGATEAEAGAHSKAVYKEFAKAMGLNEWEGEKLTDEFTVAAIVAGLREVLGTEKINNLRRAVLDQVVSHIE